MNISFDIAELRPLVRAIVDEALAASRSRDAYERLAYTEPEAASLLGVRSHVLRDARIRGEVRSTKVGGRIAYRRQDLDEYLTSQLT